MIRNPLPGTTKARNNGGYDADSGLDILVPPGTPCFAVADGEIVYSERGHTPWVNPPDTPHSILLKLDKPFTYKGHVVNFAWYTHMASLAHQVADGSFPVRVKAGQLLGTTGTGNRVPHLHLGLIADRAQTQAMPHPLVAELVWSAPPVEKPEGTRSVELLSAEFVVRDQAGNILKLFHNANGTNLVGDL